MDTKFQFCSFSCSRDTRGVPKFRIRSHDAAPTPYGLFLHSFCWGPTVLPVLYACKISKSLASAIPKICGGSQNLKVGPPHSLYGDQDLGPLSNTMLLWMYKIHGINMRIFVNFVIFICTLLMVYKLFIEISVM